MKKIHHCKRNPRTFLTTLSRFTMRAAVPTSLIAFSCGGEDIPQASTTGSIESKGIDIATFEATFEVVRTLTLEENEDALVVLPMVTLDGPDGDFILAEPQEGQVRLYHSDGRLKANLGVRGEGPGELQLPTSATRAKDGRILVADPMNNRKLILFTEDGSQPPEELSVPVGMAIAAHDLGDGRLLLVGESVNEGTNAEALVAPDLLHIFRPGSHQHERSFMKMRVPEESLAFASSFATVTANVIGDTIWAVWALSDTVYKYSLDGDRLAVVPFELSPPRPSIPTAEEMERNPGLGEEMLNKMPQTMNVFVMSNGDLVVQVIRQLDGSLVFDLLVIDPDGELVWRANNMPRIYALGDDTFYFQDPAALETSKWVIATLRAFQ